MDGQYIGIDATDHVIDLTGTLIRLLRPAAAHRGGRSFPLLVLPGGTEVFVNELGDGLAELAISHPDPTRQRLGAQRIFDTLFERTPWALRWTADDTPGVIVARPGTPRRHLMPQAG